MHASVVVNRRPYSMLPSPCSLNSVLRSVTSCKKLANKVQIRARSPLPSNGAGF